MPRLENTSEQQYDLSARMGGPDAWTTETVKVPRSNGEQGAAKVNGSADVSDEFLTALKGDKFFEALIASGELVVKTGKLSKSDTESAKASEEAAHPHAHPQHKGGR